MASLGFNYDFSDSDEDDEEEIERAMEERKRQAIEAGQDRLFDDVSDTQSVASLSNTMSNMNFIPLDTDLDNLIDDMLLQQNPHHVAELQRQRDIQLEQIREQNEHTEAILFTEENKKNFEELRQLNQLNLTEIIPSKEAAKNNAVNKEEAQAEEEKKEECGDEETKPVELQNETEKTKIIIDTSSPSKNIPEELEDPSQVSRLREEFIGA